MSFFHPSGFLAQLKPTLVFQEGRFQRDIFIPETEESISVFDKDDSSFFLLNAMVGYRLPKRHGLISIEVRNLFDKSFKFQGSDPANPIFFPERWVVGRVTLSF
jgi:outer membrane receptor protein involved in Fe transport